MATEQIARLEARLPASVYALLKRAACADGGRLGRRDAAIPLSLGLAGMFGMTQFAIYGKLP